LAICAFCPVHRALATDNVWFQAIPFAPSCSRCNRGLLRSARLTAIPPRYEESDAGSNFDEDEDSDEEAPRKFRFDHWHDWVADATSTAPKKKTKVAKKAEEGDEEDDEEEDEEEEEEDGEAEEPEAEADDDVNAKEDANGSAEKAPGAEKDRTVKTTKADEPVPVVADDEDDEE
jgi:hypothetical protein